MGLFNFWKNKRSEPQMKNETSSSLGPNSQSLAQLIYNGVVGDVKDAYKENVWAYSGIKAISTNLASVPFRLMTRTTDGTMGRDVVDVKNPWVRLFDNPNPLFDKTQLWKITTINFEIDGQAFWVLFGKDDLPIKSASDVPEYIEIPRANQLEPRYNNERTRIVGWYYKRGSGADTRIELEFFQALRFFDYDPNSMLDGLASVSASGVSIGIDQKIHSYNDQFFKNGAQIAGYLVDENVDSDISDEQLHRIRRKWDSQYQGLNNAHTTPILTNGLKFIKTGSDQKDMDFYTLAKLLREEIIGALNVPKNQVGIYEDLNYANAKIADKQFYTNNLIPKMTYFASVINSKLLYNTGLMCYFDLSMIEALKDDRDSKVEVAKGLYELGYSLNEINRIQDLGMEEIPEEWANTAINKREAEDDGVKKAFVTPEKADDKNREADEAQDSISTALYGLFNDKYEDEEDEAEDNSDYLNVSDFIHKVILPEVAKVDKKVISQVTNIRNKQLKLIDENMDAIVLGSITKDNIDDVLFDVDKEISLFHNNVSPIAELVAYEAMYYTKNELEDSFDVDELDIESVENSLADVLLDQFSPEKTYTILSLHSKVRSSIENGLSNNHSIDEIKEAVRATIGEVLKASSGVGFMELFSAANAARYVVVDSYDGKFSKVWVSKADGNTRTAHSNYSTLEPQPMNYEYSNGLKYPGDRSAKVGEVAGCRCGLKIVLTQ